MERASLVAARLDLPLALRPSAPALPPAARRCCARARGPPTHRRTTGATRSSKATIRSGTASSSARSWETSRIVPGKASSAASSASRDSTSRWFVGSSRMRKFDPDATSSASASRRRSPPESAVTERSCVSQPEKRKRPSSVLGARSGQTRRGSGRVEHRAAARELERVLREVRRARRRARAGSSRAPADGPSRMAASSVVFPAPFGPTSPTFSPRSTTIVAPSRSSFSPADSWTSSASRTTRPLRGGSRKSNPSVRRFFVSDSTSPAGRRALLLEARDLRELRLRLLRLRLLVPEALDEALEPRDVDGDAIGRLPGRCRAHCLLLTPLVPRAGEVVRSAGRELEHGGRDGLEEPAVVRDEDDRSVDRLELPLEPLEVLDVEVVRRLVEQEQVGAARERAGERRAGQLPAGERAERPVEIVVGEAEPAHGRRCPVAPGPATRVLELRLRLRVPAQRRRVVRALRHRLLEATELGLDVEEVARAGERVLAQRDVELERWALVVERDARSLRERELPALERGLAGDRAQERRLAGAVRAGQREPIAAADGERHVVEERVSGELLAQLGCDEDGHRRKGRADPRQPREAARSVRGRL